MKPVRVRGVADPARARATWVALGAFAPVAVAVALAMAVTMAMACGGSASGGPASPGAVAARPRATAKDRPIQLEQLDIGGGAPSESEEPTSPSPEDGEPPDAQPTELPKPDPPSGGAQAVPMGVVASGDTFDEAAAQRVVQAQLPAMRACYDESRARGEEAPSSATLAFTIVTEGVVREVKIDDDVPAGLRKCLEGVIGGLRFTRSSAAVRITTPLKFRDPARD